MSASWQSSDSKFALGAMLPDFATMAKVSLPAQMGMYSAGVDYHHVCDAVFHRLSEFREQESWALRHLQKAGFGRGPARGVAHVGVELALDGALVGTAKVDKLYMAALQKGLDCPPSFSSSADKARFFTLLKRLLIHGLPTGYRDSEILAGFLVRILAPRPLLRLSQEEGTCLAAAIDPIRIRVTTRADAIMDALKSALIPSAT